MCCARGSAGTRRVTAGVSLSLLSPESCARSWGTVHGQHRESLSRPEGCSQSAPAPLPAPCAFLSSELLDLSIPRLLACGSEQLHPLGGAVTAFWGVPNTPGGCRDRGGSVLGGVEPSQDLVALPGTLRGHHRVLPLCLACASCGHRSSVRAGAKISPPRLSPGAVPRGCVVSGVREPELVKRQENGSCLS